MGKHGLHKNHGVKIVIRCKPYYGASKKGFKSLSIARTLSETPWTQEGIIKSPFKDVEIPACTLHDYVWQNLEKWPDRTIAVCGFTGRGYTYSQGFKLSATFAANLRSKLGVRDGDTVAVMLPNVPDYPVVALGVLGAGGVITTINPTYTAHEIQRQLVTTGAKVIVTVRETVDVVKSALRLPNLDIPIVIVRTEDTEVPVGTIRFKELSVDVSVDLSPLKEVRRSAEDVCFLPYSSGTTGIPKGVELTNRNLVANCEQMNEPVIKMHNETTATHQDAVMAVLPFFHIYGAEVMMFHKLSQGVKLVTLPKFQPQLFLRTLEKYKCNVLYVVPPIVLLMATHPSATPKTFKHLEVIINGSAPLTTADADRFMERAKRKFDFRQGYGLTETSPAVTITPKGNNNYGCVGLPVPNTELKIVDEHIKTLGPNKKGELLIRGPQVMKGYRNDVQANKEAFTDDGWFRSGDLVFGDEHGIITVVDRLKELIKVKGFQVSPAELEGVLRDHPSVDDAAVIGVPHQTNGEAPKAFIVLKKGHNVAPTNITDFVKERVAEYKRISDVTFLEELPKNSTGKILRRELKEKYV
ncbi:4-coumarate--CoA ligase 1-like [Leguminivora glycinivorella]|uniref:4-coumarate--CoA ligase 1-like n=1 Tax=Leguminivora glycinivorella TaxID=1035111 RepID=UPI00200E8F35|nr:4-coumarate--CoA ligase 1-like [Leguminivora glycinivorella]